MEVIMLAGTTANKKYRKYGEVVDVDNGEGYFLIAAGRALRAAGGERPELDPPTAKIPAEKGGDPTAPAQDPDGGGGGSPRDKDDDNNDAVTEEEVTEEEREEETTEEEEEDGGPGKKAKASATPPVRRRKRRKSVN